MNFPLSGIKSYRHLDRVVYDKQSAVDFVQYHGLLHNTRLCALGHTMMLSLAEKNETWLEGTTLPHDTIVYFAAIIRDIAHLYLLS